MRTKISFLISFSIHLAVFIALFYAVSAPLQSPTPKEAGIDWHWVNVAIAKGEVHTAEHTAPPAPSPASSAPTPETIPEEVKEKPVQKVVEPKSVKTEKKSRKPKQVARKKTKHTSPSLENTPAPTDPALETSTAVQSTSTPAFGSNHAPASTTGSGKSSVGSAKNASSGSGGAGSKGNYQAGLRKAIARNKHYPRQAQRMRQTGVAHISFVVNPNGRFANIRLVKSSGVPALDEAALATVKKTGGYSPVPDGTSLSFTLPIEFNL